MPAAVDAEITDRPAASSTAATTTVTPGVAPELAGVGATTARLDPATLSPILTIGAAMLTPTVDAAREPFDIGELVATTSEVNLQTQPTSASEVLKVLPAGTLLQITGPAAQDGQRVWWPVLETTTQQAGFVAEEFVARPAPSPSIPSVTPTMSPQEP
jgi:hypothetical protein